jgi:hypothetical protein
MASVIASVNANCKLTAPSTIAILGMPLSMKHDSYRNKRALRDRVRAQKKKETPAGLQWNGMLILCSLYFNTQHRDW